MKKEDIDKFKEEAAKFISDKKTIVNTVLQTIILIYFLNDSFGGYNILLFYAIFVFFPAYHWYKANELKGLIKGQNDEQQC